MALVVLQIALCFLYGYHKTYHKRPFSIHQWRQTDCVSFTKNYYEEGMHFMQPKIHWQGTIEGKTISEFPLMNYTVAVLWKVFGEHEYIYRFTELILYLIAMLFLFVMIYTTSTSLLYSYFATSLITTSPLLAYYSFSFLADVPALSFAIISLSLFFIFLQTKKQNLFIFSVLIGTLAALLKASSVSVLLIIGIISLVNLIQFPQKIAIKEKLFSRKFLPIITFIISLVIIYTWYHFAFIYNHKNSNGVFLMETLPIWKMNDKVIETARLLYSVQLATYFNKGVLMALFCVCIWLFLNLKSLPSYLKIAFIISAVSFLAFILLFFQVFNVHDYYLISTMIFPVVILVCFGNYLKSISFNFMNKKIVAFVLVIFSINAVYCASVIRLRNISNDTLCKYYPFITNEEKNFSDWFHYDYDQKLAAFETITPYLRSIGLKRTDKVISIPDPSFNITLYLMDQKGFTATAQSLNADSTKIHEYIRSGAQYLVVSDTAMLHLNGVRNLNKTTVGQYKNVFVYKLN